MNLTGKWQGHYQFDPDEKLPKLPARQIPFEMTLRQSWFGKISGTAQDDPKIGMPEPARIRGRFRGQTLVLTKIHPLIRVVHEGKFESPQQLADRFHVALDEFPPAHPHIRCAGTLSDDGQVFAGKFMLASGEIHVPGSRPVITPELRGTWSMKRVQLSGEPAR